jgi:hypothetical protein
VANPHEYALIFGSPVPGYRAPVDTIDPAARVPVLLLRILADAGDAGVVAPARGRPLPRLVAADMRTLRDNAAPTLSEAVLAEAIRAWAGLIGLISFELFGHLHNVVVDYEAHFDFQQRAVAAGFGID